MAGYSKSSDIPTWAELWRNSAQRDRHQMNDLSGSFKSGFFVGKIVTNWCAPCRKWRLTYVSVAKLNAIGLDETFPCATCGDKIPLMVDQKHTLMSNVVMERKP